MLFDKVIAFDRVLQKMYLIVNIKTDDLEGNYAKAQKNLDAMEAPGPAAGGASGIHTGPSGRNHQQPGQGKHMLRMWRRSRNTSGRGRYFSGRIFPAVLRFL